jgi:gliding motility-associated-like protein
MLFMQSLNLFAQVPAPDFTCVREDTLYWAIPTVACGPITGYNVYASPQPDLPFALLATVNDPAATLYYHNNPSGDPFYYFIETIADCPGQTPLSSDTLDNLPPLESPIEYVTVIGSDVEVSWTGVEQEDVVGYVIYRVTDVGTVPLDTVTSGNTFLDTGADPDNTVEFYYVNSIDACGVTSFFDEVHNTILLSFEIDSCNQSAVVSWNNYNGWTQGIQEYQILVSEDGGPFELLDAVPPSQTVYNIPNLDKNIEYSVRIEAVRLDLAARSSSNTITFIPDIVQTVLGLNLFNADVVGPDVEVYWTWDVTSTISDASLIVLENGNNTVQILDVTPMPGEILTVLNRVLVQQVDPVRNVYTFVLAVTDSCGTVVESNAMSTIRLTGNAGAGNTANIAWNSPNMSMRIIQSIELFRINQSGGREFWTTVGITETNATDSEIQGSTACYLLEANGSVLLADGTTFEFDQTSNETCVSRPIRVYFPNALSPNGVNNIYKPEIINQNSITSYDMKIYDRWGKVIFQSRDPLVGWDGRSEGDLVKAGLYTYYIEIEQINGRDIKRAGEIHVLY